MSEEQLLQEWQSYHYMWATFWFIIVGVIIVGAIIGGVGVLCFSKESKEFSIAPLLFGIVIGIFPLLAAMQMYTAAKHPHVESLGGRASAREMIEIQKRAHKEYSNE